MDKQAVTTYLQKRWIITGSMTGMQKNNQKDQTVSSGLGPTKAQSGSSLELFQSLSAMMDDEAENLELRRVVKASASDSELAAKWGRYHAVRASLRQEMHQHPAVDILSGIREQLAAEPVAGRPVNRSIASRVLRLAGQGAIAASVAAAVLFGSSLQIASDRSAPDTQQMVAVDAGTQQSMPALNGDFSASPLTRTVSLDDAARDRLARAVRNYSGTSAVLNTATTPMFRSQLEPFTVSQPVASPAANSSQQ